MNINAQRLRDLIEYKERQAHAAESNEKQTMLVNAQIQMDLKKAKDEIKKLSSTYVLTYLLTFHDTEYNGLPLSTWYALHDLTFFYYFFVTT